MNMAYQIEEEVLLELELDAVPMCDLVIYNDEVNTFEHVIATLISVCKHSSEQAEQCTIIIHYKGKCGVKKGSYADLMPYRTALCDSGLSAEIC
jgi:ATP-dependent Clp protease adaptor protein ClpS